MYCKIVSFCVKFSRNYGLFTIYLAVHINVSEVKCGTDWKKNSSSYTFHGIRFVSIILNASKQQYKQIFMEILTLCFEIDVKPLNIKQLIVISFKKYLNSQILLYK